MDKLTAARLAASMLLLAVMASAVDAQQAAAPAILGSGNAVVAGFSGVIAPDPRAPRAANKSLIDLTFINPDGPSARIVDVASPEREWDARLWPTSKPHDVLAKDVGQVFGVALDDENAPNIYLSATSAFGLNLVRRAPDGTVERLKTGGPGAQWQAAQFGLALQGGPGSIYRVDGRTGTVTLLANVMLDGVPNPGPGLGNLAYDAAHKQLFVSDLYTGMIHRFAIADGAEPGPAFDHGVTARVGNLPAVPFDARNRPNIATAKFDSLNPDTWGYAPPERRVWGLAVHDGRLFYSARNGASADGPQIWSVGIAQDGSFAADPRWELDVPAQPGPFAVSDIVFSQGGAMILAQRAPVAAAYDYSTFTKPGEPRVLRYWLENPDDPKTPSRWIPQPEEYAVGFPANYRNTNGGVALGYGYGYGQDGQLHEAVCEFSLWTTGQNLRNDPAMRNVLEPGGPLVVHGLQGSPASPVRTFNEPPTTSYFIDYDDHFDDPTATGHLGGVRIRGCGAATGGALVAYGGPGVVATAPYLADGPGSDGGGGGAGGGGCYGPGCHWPPNVWPIDIAIKKTAGTVRFDESSGTWTVEFKLDVTNVGFPFTPGNAIAVTDPVPAGLTFVSGVGTNWSCAVASGNVNCGYIANSGLFNTGAHLNQLVLTFTTKAPRKYENCASVGVARRPSQRETRLDNNRDCATVDIKTPPKACFASKGAFECDSATGKWVYKLTVAGPAWVDAVSAMSQTAGVSVPSGAIPLNPASIAVTGPPGTAAVLDVCAFKSADAASGKPYDCCRAKLTVAIPTSACGIKK